MTMKLSLLLAAVFASVSLPAFGQENKSSNDLERAVLKLEQEWEDALLKSDAAALERIYDDSLIYTHSNGGTDNKSSYVGKIKSGATKYQTMKRDDIKVNVYGSSAVVTCHWDVHTLANGTKYDTDARYIHVYVKQKDGWKMVAHQATLIVK
jgi:ketosteroid isomerase-like protein